MRTHNRLVFGAAICLALVWSVAPAQAQVATLLLLEGDALPGAPGETVTSINNSGVNHAGGYAFTVNGDDGINTISHTWGHAAGGPGSVLWTEGTYGIFTQSSFESFFGISDAMHSVYSPSCTNNETGSTSLDSMWRDDFVVAMEEEVYPHQPDTWWSFASRGGSTADGIPYFVGGLRFEQTGSTDNRGLFYGLDASPVIVGGDFITGLPDPLDTASTVSFDCRFSALGTHYIAEVQTLTGSSSNNNHMVIDTAVIMLDGTPVSEDTPVPPAAGGINGENWDNFDYTGITEEGRYMFTGDTNGDTASDEFILVDGVITYREGMMLDGYVISGAIESAYMNADGDVAFIWDIDTPEGNVEALYVEDVLLLKEGDTVDIDGDLIPDEGAVVVAFTGISAMTMSDRMGGEVKIYFTADIELTVPAGKRGFVASGGELVVPDDAAGLTVEDVAELDLNMADPTQQVLEGGFVITVPTTVPVFLTSFAVLPTPGLVNIEWAVHADDPVEFRLLVLQDGQERELVYQTEGNSWYSAGDEQARSGEATYTLFYRSTGGEWTQLGSQTVNVETPLLGTRLLGAHPNPFNPHTEISFSLRNAEQVQISLYSMSGHLIRVLADDVLAQGSHTIAWDGKDASGRNVAAGTYLVRLQTATEQDRHKIMLVK